MTYINMSPWKNFERAAKRMGEFAGQIEKGFTLEAGTYTPRTDITEDNTNYYMYIELPGISKEDVKISVNEERELSIQGTKKATAEIADKTLLKSERQYGEFGRTFLLPENLDVKKISAKFENGILTLSMPKVEPPKPEEFEITID